MATNRDKYIDNATNEELATKLAYRDVCSMCIRAEQGIMPSECGMYGANCEKFIKQWLDMEVEDESN